jgi:hypothetical protein
VFIVLISNRWRAPEAEPCQAVVVRMLRQLLRQVLELVGGHACAA